MSRERWEKSQQSVKVAICDLRFMTTITDNWYYLQFIGTAYCRLVMPTANFSIHSLDILDI